MRQRSFFTTLFHWMVGISMISLSHVTLADNAIDRRVALDTGGIWQHYDHLEKALLVTSLSGALWLGSDDRLGRTFWQGTEAYFISQGISEVLKGVTGRQRPDQTDDPDRWFKNGRSFPSGHVAGTTALVTPFLLEYADDYPAMWVLAILPAYEMVARVKAQAHWQTDVLAGAALGIAAGYLTHRRGPFLIRVLPGGVFVGIREVF